MTTIVTRAGKGSPLSWAEGDANFNNLNNDKLETSDIGVTVQAQNANLQTIANTITAAGLAILDDASASAQRTTLGLAIGTDVQAQNSNLQTIATSATAAGLALLDDADAAAQRATLGLSFIANRNALINGNFKIDQRNAGVAQTITAGAALAYTLDRWYAYCTGANVTTQQIASSGENRLRFTGLASNTAIGLGQRIEDVNCMDLAGNTATLSCKLSSTSLTSITWTAYYANTADTFGTLASPTKTQIATGTFTITSTEATYSTNISIPAPATTGIEIVFTGGALLGTQTLTIGDVQLEKGSVRTEFEVRPYGLELALCQRYYAKTFDNQTAPAQNAGTTNAAGARATVTAQPIQFNWCLPETMRGSPTVTTYNTTAANANWSANPSSPTVVVSVGTEVITIFGTTNTVAGNGYTIHATASAEL